MWRTFHGGNEAGFPGQAAKVGGMVTTMVDCPFLVLQLVLCICATAWELRVFGYKSIGPTWYDPWYRS
eukprot:2106372-Rhodomonas_salina.1